MDKRVRAAGWVVAMTLAISPGVRAAPTDLPDDAIPVTPPASIVHSESQPVAAAEILAAEGQPLPPPPPPPTASGQPAPDQWIDRMQQHLFNASLRTAMRVDRFFGSKYDETAYEGVSGSAAPALLWDQFHGFQPRMRFNVNLPLPQINKRFYAFIGRVNPDEYISERDPESGAFRRQYGPPGEDRTLLGVNYREQPREGSHFDAGAGVKLDLPLDPYVKGSYTYQHGKPETLLFNVRETGFWQQSDQLGATTRVDVERLFSGPWLVRWTSSGTISQRSQGVRGYSAISALRGFPSRRAVAVEVGFDGEAEAPVPLHDYGIKLAYRQSISRDWLIMEIRTSWDYPKDLPEQTRKGSFGVGLGFEMFFGTGEFLGRPSTF